MTIIVELIREFPLKRSTRNLFLIKFLITSINVTSILFIELTYVSIGVAVITLSYVWFLEWVQNRIKKDLIGVARNRRHLLILNHFLTLSFNSKGLTYIHFDGKDTERLLDYTKKIKYDINWLGNLVLILHNLGENRALTDILSKVNRESTIPFKTLNNIILVLFGLRDFNLLTIYMDILDRDYLNINYRNTLVNFYLSYFVITGDKDNFYQLIKNEGLSNTNLANNYIKAIENSTFLPEYKRDIPNLDFTVKPQQRSLIPLYIGIGIVVLYTFANMFLSRGGSLNKRIIEGAISGIDYIRFGAFSKYHVLNGEWIRLFTSALLHGGIIHLAVNSYSTYNLGRALFQLLRKRYVLFIFLSGTVGGGLLSLTIESDTLISIGASTGVFGLLGALIIYFIWHRKSFNKSHFNRVMVNFLIIGIIQVYYGLSSENINNMGHLGGFLGGCISSLIVLTISNNKLFEKIILYTNIAIISFISISIPSMITRDYASEINLIKYDYYRPDYWVKGENGGGYIDYFYHSAFNFDHFFYEGDMESLINEVKLQASEGGLGLPVSEGIYYDNWYSIQLNKNLNDFNLYYFYKLKGKDLYRCELYIKPQLFNDFEPLLKRILTKSTEL